MAGKEPIVAISTIDNPYDPIDQPDEWFATDIQLGHNSCNYLARIAHTSDAMTDGEKMAEVERAIDEILKYDPLHIYIKVKH